MAASSIEAELDGCNSDVMFALWPLLKKPVDCWSTCLSLYLKKLETLGLASPISGRLKFSAFLVSVRKVSHGKLFHF